MVSGGYDTSDFAKVHSVRLWKQIDTNKYKLFKDQTVHSSIEIQHFDRCCWPKQEKKLEFARDKSEQEKKKRKKAQRIQKFCDILFHFLCSR